MITVKEVQDIILPISGKNVADRRIAALVAKGYKVDYYDEKLNWGTSGSAKQDGDAVLFQPECAQAVKSSKTGWSYNRCHIYRASK